MTLSDKVLKGCVTWNSLIEKGEKDVNEVFYILQKVPKTSFTPTERKKIRDEGRNIKKDKVKIYHYSETFQLCFLLHYPIF